MAKVDKTETKDQKIEKVKYDASLLLTPLKDPNIKLN